MLFSVKTAAKAVTILSVFGLSSAAADVHLCSGDGPYDVTKQYGKVGGEDLNFCDSKWDKGITVTGIEAWSTKWHVRAFQLTYSDGSKGPLHGDSGDTEGNNGGWWAHQSLSWKEGDMISDAHLAGNYWNHGDALGMIHMEQGGNVMDVKSDVGKSNGEPQKLSSGILLGAFGTAGDYVNSFGFMFLKSTVGKSEIVEIKFPQTLEDLNNQQKGVKSFNIKNIQFKNISPEGSGNQTFSFSNLETATVSKTLTQDYTHTFGTEISTTISGEVSVPLFAEAKVENSFKASYGYSTTTSTGETKTDSSAVTFTINGSLMPQKGVDCKATAIRGEYASDYTSIVQVTLDDGQKFKVEVPGHYESIGYARGDASCPEKDIKDLNDNAEEIGSPATKRAIGFSA
ncbi:hypothetical protein P280DRAFT_467257 [Massarina eburnea CBS 473.64]|uniref:Jacalin-type lectin domain-containing protein n=1 Tax=Massarina eburnea CBS 473.64 TaxID=1395130 RepID=A0A6A6S7K9_9PLEO|nr:hypothetical protein P280DRAFT_467257 [Massarina eburnea CBS 473.64]